jgi:putative endonuclease
MPWFVYILRCKDDSLYTGITWNLKNRIRDHNTGKYHGFTKSRLPVKLVYWEKCFNRFIAAKREKEIKGWRRDKKETLINSLR